MRGSSKRDLSHMSSCPIFIYPPVVILASSNALLRPSPGPDGYTSRLFLSVAFPHRGQNWTTHHILDRTWHAFSYNNVQADLPFIEILSNHLAVLK